MVTHTGSLHAWLEAERVEALHPQTDRVCVCRSCFMLPHHSESTAKIYLSMTSLYPFLSLSSCLS